MARINFYGGVGTVTGSKYLLESDRGRVLVDCGLFQGPRELRERNWQDPPFDPRVLDAVIITHAHIDHTGYLPRLVKLGYSGPVFTSRATADLLRILLPDSGRLQEEEADYRNRHDLTRHSPALPLYDEADARRALELLMPVENNAQPVEICNGYKASFAVAGHIVGASLVLVTIENAGGSAHPVRPLAPLGRRRASANPPQAGGGPEPSVSEHEKGRRPIRFLFSGDLGHYDQPILNDPAAPADCDYLMVESTYGNRLHGEISAADQMARIINEAAEQGGPILI
ncbi:MAG: MBL fold metallo-hydrolase, partial [Acidobacteria bacterium]|nr:MBL fold metallo-hydrolase [Acidobacteriota bacterium]MCA1607917.1 MBL fold metallo-hydrolase [Acidobacteriota bacterium]